MPGSKQQHLVASRAGYFLPTFPFSAQHFPKEMIVPNAERILHFLSLDCEVPRLNIEQELLSP
jgi:hypothetical protein